MKIGIMQGRLSPPVGNHVQQFPLNWEKEFELLDSCGVSCVEWLVTKLSVKNNPLFGSHSLLKENNISSICADNLVDKRIGVEIFLNDNLRPICIAARNNNIPSITIPLLEDSNMKDDKLRQKFVSHLRPITNDYKDLIFSFEAELEMIKLEQIIDKEENYHVTYDTGNITSCGFSHEEYIETFKARINNVHLKDRTWDAQTVAPLTGDTDFPVIFKKLSEIQYDGPYIIQTARGLSGDEFSTIDSHAIIFKQLMETYGIV